MGFVWLSRGITRRRSKSQRNPMKMITFDTQMTFYPRCGDTGSFFLLWHASLCGCYSSQIYHFNGEVVRPEDYLRDKYITVASFRYRPNVIVPPTPSFKTNVLRYLRRCRRIDAILQKHPQNKGKHAGGGCVHGLGWTFPLQQWEKGNYFILSENKATTESPVPNPQDSSCSAAKQSERSSAIFGFL